MAEHILKYKGTEVDALFEKIDNLEIDTLSNRISELENNTQTLELLEGATENIQAQLNNKAFKTEIPTKISELENDNQFITNTVNNLTNYYLKSESYTREEVNSLVGALTSLHMEVVTELPTENISTTTIYLKGNETLGNNDYEEWIYVNNNWEAIGVTEIDLTGVALLSDIPTKLSQFINDTNFVDAQFVNNAIDEVEVSAESIPVGTLSAGMACETPTENAHIANKAYVDAMFSSIDLGTDGKVYVITDNESEYVADSLPTMITAFQKVLADYLAGTKICVIIDIKCNLAHSGVYLIDEDYTNESTLYLEQVHKSVDWSSGKSTSSIGESWYGIRAIVGKDYIPAVEWKNGAGASAEGAYLATDIDYEIPYTPQYEGSPATKKYVDEAIANMNFSNVLTQNGTVEYTPTEANDVTTKSYVDEVVKSAVEDQLKATY